MYLIACFALAYALMRAARRGTALFLGLFAMLLLACEVVERMHLSLPVVDNTGNLVFGTLLFLAIAVEVRLRRHGDRTLDARWVAAAVGTIAVAFVIWNLSKTGSVLCRPHSPLQGHAAWHLLCAVAAWCLYRYWSSAGDDLPETPARELPRSQTVDRS